MAPRPMFLAFGFVLALVAITTLAAPNYSRHTMSESWDGLAGVVLLDNKETTIPKLLWQLGRPQPKLVDGKEQTPDKDEAHLSIVGERIISGRPSLVLKRSEYDGLWLSYPLEGEPGTLSLTKTSGKNTAWKVLKGKESKNRQKVGGTTSYRRQETFDIQLEALHRPGWFLTVNDQGYLTLSAEQPPKHQIKVHRSYYYDDLNDGK